MFSVAESLSIWWNVICTGENGKLKLNNIDVLAFGTVIIYTANSILITAVVIWQDIDPLYLSLTSICQLQNIFKFIKPMWCKTNGVKGNFPFFVFRIVVFFLGFNMAGISLKSVQLMTLYCLPTMQSFLQKVQSRKLCPFTLQLYNEATLLLTNLETFIKYVVTLSLSALYVILVFSGVITINCIKIYRLSLAAYTGFVFAVCFLLVKMIFLYGSRLFGMSQDMVRFQWRAEATTIWEKKMVYGCAPIKIKLGNFAILDNEMMLSYSQSVTGYIVNFLVAS